MKLKNILIVVKDIEKSRQFYHDLFGLELIRNYDGNMILTEGLVLQDEKIWKSFLEKEIIPESNLRWALQCDRNNTRICKSAPPVFEAGRC